MGVGVGGRKQAEEADLGGNIKSPGDTKFKKADSGAKCSDF